MSLADVFMLVAVVAGLLLLILIFDRPPRSPTSKPMNVLDPLAPTQPLHHTHFADKPIILGFQKNRKSLDVQGVVNEHTHIIGVPGSGKSKLMTHLWFEHFKRGHGVSFIDPHGQSAEEILGHLVQAEYFKDPHAYEKVRYFEFSEGDWYLPFNILKLTDISEADRIALIIEAMKRVFPELDADHGSANFDVVTDHCLNICMQMDWSMVETERILSSKKLWTDLKEQLQGDNLKSFFEMWWTMGSSQQYTMGSALRRAHQLNSHPITLNTLGQYENELDLRPLIDKGYCIIVNLGKVRSEQRKQYLGALILHAFEQAAFSRDTDKIRNHYLLVDEFPTIAAKGKSLSNILDQARKYGLFLTMAHQRFPAHDIEYIRAMQTADIKIGFKVGADDAEVLARTIGHVDPNRTRNSLNLTNAARAFSNNSEDFIGGLASGMVKGAGAWEKQSVPVSTQIAEWLEAFKNLEPRTFYTKIGNNQAIRLTTPDLPNPTANIQPIVDEYHRLYYTKAQEVVLPTSPDWRGKPKFTPPPVSGIKPP